MQNVSKQPLRKGAGVKILIGIILLGSSISRILYAPAMADPNQEIGAKTVILALLITGAHLIVSGIKRWNKE